MNIVDAMLDGWSLHTSEGCFHYDIWLQKDGEKFEIPRDEYNFAGAIMKSDKVKKIADPVRSTTRTAHYILV